MAGFDPFEGMGGVYEEAGKIFDEAMGVETDEELSFYQSLEPQDLQSMAKVHGLTGTIQFVKKMEAKRLRR